jgi:succinate dehydrogenase / fumarate reductase membrane anchor subunit
MPVSHSRSFRSPLARVRGLGAAKAGTQAWWAMRVTSIALVPLSIWFVASVVSLAGADHAAVVHWLSQPLVAILMVLLMGVTFHHAAAGIHEILVDYIHVEWVRIAATLIVDFAALLLAATAIFAVLKIAFTG